MSMPGKKEGRGRSQSVSCVLQQDREGRGPAALVQQGGGAALLDEEDDARIDAGLDHLRPRNDHCLPICRVREAYTSERRASR
jgi:hypothetical protein